MLFKRKSIRRRFIALSVCALLSAALLPAAPPVMNARAASLSEMQAESERLKKEADALQAQINTQAKSRSNQQAYKSTLDKKIANTKAQLDLLGERISGMNKEIAALNAGIEEKENAIAQREQDIAERMEMLRLRLRALSKTGNLSVVQMLMDTESYTDYLIRSKMMERAAESDQALMDEMEQELEIMNAEKEKLAEDKEEAAQQLSGVQSLKKEADSQKAELDVLYGKANAALKNIEGSLKNYQQQLKSTEAEQAALERKIVQIIRDSQSTGKYSGGTMFWPVPAVRNISSFYGMRWGRMHRGIDIANGSVPVYGQNIVATASGQVIYSNSTNTWGGGFGYYLIIDHGLDSAGRRISTLYAHCSKVFAKTGDYVVGGQTVIALAGATGNVTGPHLHFEVRVNGTAVDPIANGYIRFG